MLRHPHILRTTPGHCLQLALKIPEHFVVGVAKPRSHVNPVLLLQFEVFLQVVHQNHSTEVPTHPAQVFYQLLADLHRVLPVQPNTDHRQVLENDVCVLFERAGEDAHLEVRL